VSVIQRLEAEVERLEELKKANIEKFVINLRDELHQLWDECYYSEQQRCLFIPKLFFYVRYCMPVTIRTPVQYRYCIGNGAYR
jgi:hypothetical protein